MNSNFIVVCLMVVTSTIIAPLLLASDQASAQMMNPKMMGNPNMIKMMRNFTGNGSWTPDNMGSMMMNPNMMGNMMMNPNMMGNMMGDMMTFGQNVTGSINLMNSMFNSVASQIKVNLTDAVATAQQQLGEKSRVVAANLGIDNGFLTYTIRAIDPDMKMHTLIIDPANGKVLLTQNMPSFRMMGPMMGNMMMNPNMMGPNMGGMMTPWMMSHMWR
jgi:hypothetical protein